MPVNVSWLVENQVIYVEMVGTISIKDIQEASVAVVEMIDGSSAPLVHAIQDAHQMTSIPHSIKATSDAVREGYSHPRLGWTVAFGVDNPMFKYIGNIVGQIFRIRYKIVPTRREALQWLQQVDSTLYIQADLY